MAIPLSAIAKIQKKVWDGSLPLEIRLANADCRTYDETDPYLVYYILSLSFSLEAN